MQYVNVGFLYCICINTLRSLNLEFPWIYYYWSKHLAIGSVSWLISLVWLLDLFTWLFPLFSY